MKKFFTWLFILVFEALTIGAPGYAFAAPSVASGGAYNTNRIINSIINNTPGMTTMRTTGTGVFVTARGSVTASGLSIPMTAEALATPGRLAGLAARAVRVGSWVGIATMVIPFVIENSDIKVCPPPDFFCKPGSDIASPTTVAGGWSYTDPWSKVIKKNIGSAQGACDMISAGVPANEAQFYGAYKYYGIYNGNHVCIPTSGQYANTFGPSVVINNSPATCPEGYTLKGTDCVKPGPDRPATETEIGTQIETNTNGNSTKLGTLYGNLSGSNIQIFGGDDAVTVTAPPVTAPPVISTTTKPNSDGSLDTITTKTEMKVTPAVQGGTLANTTVTYPTTTTTTTTTTNNVTNVTTNTTNVTNATPQATPGSEVGPGGGPLPDTGPPADPSKPEPAPKDFPKDYNKEVTQIGILEKLKEMTGQITATAPTGDDQLTAQKAKNDEGVTAVGNITEGATGLKGWMPKINATACVNPKVPNPISGSLVEVSICDSVDIFAKFFGAVVSVFALYGSIREVQSAMKA